MKFDKNDEMSPFTRKVMGAFNFCGDKLLQISRKTDTIPGKIPEILFLILFTVCYSLVLAVHEPGMDVLSSWQLAKDSSVTELLFQLPHEQFCPPLWNLILVPFAKSGAAPAVLAFIGLFFAVLTAALILFFAPFPRLIRLFLPFTYFLFYQYGVAADNYHLVTLGFVTVSLTYKMRDTRPGIYTLCLLLLGMSGTYGLVAALGLAIVRGCELINNRKVGKQMICLLVFFAIAVCTIIMIFPNGKLPAMGSGKDVIIKLLYLPFAILSDAFLTNAFYLNASLGAESVRISFLAVSVFFGIMILSLVLYYGRKKKTAGAFFIPYVLLAVFSMVMGIGRKHIGIVFLLVLFWLWITCAVRGEERTGDLSFSVHIRERDKKALKSASVLGVVIVFAINLYWTYSACAHDVRKEYEIGRREAEFLKEHKLDACTIMSSQSCLHTLAPYLENDRLGNDSDEKENLVKWGSLGQPDVLYMGPDITKVWSEEETAGWEYTLVYLEAVEAIWKTESDYQVASIYVKSELARELGLDEITNVYPGMK